jgi:hypothetical protein
VCCIALHCIADIIKPIQQNGFSGTGKQAMIKLRSDVLHKIQLRRTKAIVAKDINLPPLTVKIVKITIRDDERDFCETETERENSLAVLWLLTWHDMTLAMWFLP